MAPTDCLPVLLFFYCNMCVSLLLKWFPDLLLDDKLELALLKAILPLSVND